MPSADFRCPRCSSTSTLFWDAGEEPPKSESCEFCSAIEPLRRDWAPVSIGAGSAGGTPPRPSRR